MKQKEISKTWRVIKRVVSEILGVYYFAVDRMDVPEIVAAALGS